MADVTHLHLDFETRSRVDIRAAGASRYSRDPSTRVLLLGWAIDDEPVEVVRFAEGEKAPPRLREALRDPSVLKFAWNADFEKNILSNTLGLRVPHEQWRDVMVLALTLSMPGSLDKVGTIIGLPEDKQKIARGKALVRKFCTPRRPTAGKPYEWSTHETDPDEWAEFVEYCRRDVEAERAIWRRLRKWDLPPHEWETWVLDQEINDAGIPVNMRVVRNAVRVYREVIAGRLAEMARITGVDNPNSTAQLLPWLQANGYPFEDLKKGHVARALERFADEPDHPAARVLGLRSEVSKSSVKKYDALAAATDDDGFLRGAFQFAGAQRTWRWSGRKFQPQNLARPARGFESPEAQEQAVRDLEHLNAAAIELLYDRPMDLLSTCVRPVVQALPGHVFVDADLNAIENRVLGWMAQDQKILDVFRNNRDPYIDFATYMYGQPYDVLWHEYKKEGKKEKRTVAKPGVLGCGYMLSAGEQRENPKTGEIEATGLLGYAWNMGVNLTPEQARLSVEVWRATFEGAVQFWWDIDRAARLCISSGRTVECGPVRFERSGPFMRMVLPSGRALHYCRPRLEERVTPWGKKKLAITYEGLDDKNQWVRISTHPGKLTENADQAIARDLLAHGMRLARREGLDIRLHVHDQICAMVPEDRAEESLQLLIQCMSERPKWAPDIPLGAAGAISRIFVKD